MLPVDETGFLKKGSMSTGVAHVHRHGWGVENCQVGVFAAYVTPDGGRALVDPELYRQMPVLRAGTGAGRPGSATTSRSPSSRNWLELWNSMTPLASENAASAEGAAKGPFWTGDTTARLVAHW